MTTKARSAIANSSSEVRWKRTIRGKRLDGWKRPLVDGSHTALPTALTGFLRGGHGLDGVFTAPARTGEQATATVGGPAHSSRKRSRQITASVSRRTACATTAPRWFRSSLPHTGLHSRGHPQPQPLRSGLRDQQGDAGPGRGRPGPRGPGRAAEPPQASPSKSVTVRTPGAQQFRCRPRSRTAPTPDRFPMPPGTAPAHSRLRHPGGPAPPARPASRHHDVAGVDAAHRRALPGPGRGPARRGTDRAAPVTSGRRQPGGVHPAAPAARRGRGGQRLVSPSPPSAGPPGAPAPAPRGAGRTRPRHQTVVGARRSWVRLFVNHAGTLPEDGPAVLRPPGMPLEERTGTPPAVAAVLAQ